MQVHAKLLGIAAIMVASIESKPMVSDYISNNHITDDAELKEPIFYDYHNILSGYDPNLITYVVQQFGEPEPTPPTTTTASPTAGDGHEDKPDDKDQLNDEDEPDDSDETDDSDEMDDEDKVNDKDKLNDKDEPNNDNKWILKFFSVDESAPQIVREFLNLGAVYV